MESVLIVFLSGIFALFFGIAKKPLLVTISSLIGLLLAGIIQCQDITFLAEKYHLIEFTKENQPFFYLSLVLAGLILLSGQSVFKNDESTIGDLTGLMLFSLSGGLILLGFKDLFMFFLGLLWIGMFFKIVCL